MAAHGCSYLIHNTAGRLLQGCGGSRAAAQPADAGPIAKLSHKWPLVITHWSTLRNGEMTFQLQSNSKLHSIFCNRPKTISSFHSLPSDSYLFLPCPLSLGNISGCAGLRECLCSLVLSGVSVTLGLQKKGAAMPRTVDSCPWAEQNLKYTAYFVPPRAPSRNTIILQWPFDISHLDVSFKPHYMCRRSYWQSWLHR